MENDRFSGRQWPPTAFALNVTIDACFAQKLQKKKRYELFSEPDISLYISWFKPLLIAYFQSSVMFISW